MDFVEKKDEIAQIIEKYASQEVSKDELISKINELSNDLDFKDKDLFKTIFSELVEYVDELSSKELRQRALIIRSYMP